MSFFYQSVMIQSQNLGNMRKIVQKSLIIFDLDGTLIDSVPDIAVAVNAMLTSFDAHTADISHVRTWVGNGSRILTKRALIWANLPTDDEHLTLAHDRFLSAYARCTCQDTRAYDGVTQGLDTLLQAGYLLAIATNKPTCFVPEILTKLGWTDKFTVVLGGDSLPTKKPDPMPLLHICHQLNISTQHAIMVGDSKNDIQAGKNAHITTLALTYGYNYDEPIANSCPDGVFDNFESLVDFILHNHTNH